MKLKTLLAIFFATLIVIFSLQNAEVTDVKFIVWKISISRVLVILGSFSLGVLVGILISMKKRFLNTEKE
ncbi:MAG: LapA family protein [Croceitalea sp.]|nr:LapA family protein [Croceitalea sp.]NNC34386.1 LapA family protein [Croceitalea sp.]NNL09158.1 LapA family protein [Croceitalea sp.]